MWPLSDICFAPIPTLDPWHVAQGYYEAVTNGHLEMIRYLYQHIAPDARKQAFILAIQKGQIEILRYLYQMQAMKYRNAYYSYYNWAIMSNEISVVRFVHKKKLQPISHARVYVSNAFRLGNMEIVRYVCRHANYTPGVMDVKSAVENGHIEPVAFFYEQCHVLPYETALLLVASARYGQLATVRILHQKYGADLTQINHKSYSRQIRDYVRVQLWLQREVSDLRKWAAKCYVQYYDLMPDPESVPVEITRILQASKMSRCQDVKMSRCQDVKMSRCQDVVSDR